MDHIGDHWGSRFCEEVGTLGTILVLKCFVDPVVELSTDVVQDCLVCFIILGSLKSTFYKDLAFEVGVGTLEGAIVDLGRVAIAFTLGTPFLVSLMF